MTKQLSFTKIENDLLPEFRKKIATAESTEDIKKFFVYTMQDLFDRVFDGKIELEFDDISLHSSEDSSYRLHDRIQSMEVFLSACNSSDLSQVISRFADAALKNLKHIEKNPAKTESKIRK